MTKERYTVLFKNSVEVGYLTDFTGGGYTLRAMSEDGNKLYRGSVRRDSNGRLTSEIHEVVADCMADYVNVRLAKRAAVSR